MFSVRRCVLSGLLLGLVTIIGGLFIICSIQSLTSFILISVLFCVFRFSNVWVSMGIWLKLFALVSMSSFTNSFLLGLLGTTNSGLVVMFFSKV